MLMAMLMPLHIRNAEHARHYLSVDWNVLSGYIFFDHAQVESKSAQVSAASLGNQVQSSHLVHSYLECCWLKDAAPEAQFPRMPQCEMTRHMRVATGLPPDL